MAFSVGPWSYRDATWPAPLSVFGAAVVHFGQHFGRLLNPRRTWSYWVLMLLPTIASAGLARLALDDTSRIGFFYQHFAMRALALCALGLGVAAIREDTEAGAMPTLLLRPRAAIALPIGRVVATALFCTLLGAAMTVGFNLSLLGSPFVVDFPFMLRQAAAISFGSLAYAGVFMAIGAWFKSGTGVGLAFLLVVDLIGATKIDSLAHFAPAHYLDILIQTLPGRDVTAAQTADQIPGALVGLLLLGALGTGLTTWRMSRDLPAP